MEANWSQLRIGGVGGDAACAEAVGVASWPESSPPASASGADAVPGAEANCAKVLTISPAGATVRGVIGVSMTALGDVGGLVTTCLAGGGGEAGGAMGSFC